MLESAAVNTTKFIRCVAAGIRIRRNTVTNGLAVTSAPGWMLCQGTNRDHFNHRKPVPELTEVPEAAGIHAQQQQGKQHNPNPRRHLRKPPAAIDGHRGRLAADSNRLARPIRVTNDKPSPPADIEFCVNAE